MTVQTLWNGIKRSRENAKTVRASACYEESVKANVKPPKNAYHSRKADKLDDDEATNGEEDTARLAQTVVEELSHWLVQRSGQNLGRITHAEAENDIEQETGQVGEDHSQGDSPGSFDLWLRDLFSDVCCCIVIGHGP